MENNQDVATDHFKMYGDYFKVMVTALKWTMPLAWSLIEDCSYSDSMVVSAWYLFGKVGFWNVR